MKQFATLILLLSFSIPTYAQIVEFEDGNFKAYLIELGIDTNGDGEIQNRFQTWQP